MQHWNEWEIDILQRLLAKGVTADEIAGELNRSKGSVARKIDRLKAKQPIERAINSAIKNSVRPPATTMRARRSCLSCGRKFKSDGIGHRICDACKENHRGLGHLEGVTK